jgi:hypothetical protein
MKRQISHLIGSDINNIYDILTNDEYLNDDCIMTILNFMNTISKEDDIIIIDSHYPNMFLYPNEEHSQFKNAKKSLLKGFSNKNNENRIYILPLNDSHHWSLLVYIEKYLKWYHFDSLSIKRKNIGKNKQEEEDEEHYHQNFVNKLLRKFINHSIFNDSDNINVEYLDFKSKNQDSDWECGQYLLMYAKLIIKYLFNNKKLYNCHDFESYIESNLDYCTEEHRVKFIDDILNEFSKL